MKQEIKKEEALKRMQALELLPECIDAFKNNNNVWISEGIGILFELSQRPEILEEIKRFEAKYDALVYHCALTHFNEDVLVSMFYVSDEKDEWYLDWDDMQDNYACVYTANLTYPTDSEIGSIQYRKINGGVQRIA